MAGTRAGGLQTAAKLKAADPDYYSKIGKQSYAGWVEGGKKPRGFAFDREKARVAGAIGGRKSRRGKK